MLLPLAFVFIAAFVLLAIWLIVRKARGKTDKRSSVNNERSANYFKPEE